MIKARVAAISTSGQRDQRALRSPRLNTVNIAQAGRRAGNQIIRAAARMDGELPFAFLKTLQGIVHGGLQIFVGDIAVEVETKRRRTAGQRPARLHRRQDVNGGMFQAVIAAGAQNQREIK